MKADNPTTILDFQRRFDSEEACEAVLFRWRWPDGFRCPRCGGAEATRRRRRHVRTVARAALADPCARDRGPRSPAARGAGPQSIRFEASDPVFETLLHSSETSGGLLIAVPPEGADALRDRLHDEGHGVAEVVGRVVAEHPGKVRVID